MSPCEHIFINKSILSSSISISKINLLKINYFIYRYIASGPLVRSSYKAGEFFIESMIN